MQDRFPNPSTFRNIALYGGQTLLVYMYVHGIVCRALNICLSLVNQLNCHLFSRSALLEPVCEKKSPRSVYYIHCRSAVFFFDVIMFFCSTGSMWEDNIFFGFRLFQVGSINGFHHVVLE